MIFYRTPDMDIVKVILVNTVAFVVSIFNVGVVNPGIKEVLQIMLVAVTIGYTLFKWSSDYRKNNKGNGKDK